MGTIATVTPAGKRYPQRIGTFDAFLGTVTMTSSYATGGDTLTARSLGMNVIEGGFVGPFGGNIFRLIPQTDGSAKILGIVSTTGAELANASNNSTNVLQAFVIGH